MKKVKIDFDFSKWGQRDVDTTLKGHTIQTLHKHPNAKVNECFYGIDGFGHAFKTYLNSGELEMYQEIKPREIWVNEYQTIGCTNSCIYQSEEEAIKNKSRNYIRTIKFREVLDDEQ